VTQYHSSTPSAPDDAVVSDAPNGRDIHDVVARVLSRTGTALASTAAQHEQADGYQNGADDGALEREARAARRRVAGLSTELEDVSEVEYRQVRLEKVVLVGLELPRPHGSAIGAPGGSGLQVRDTQDADTSLRELAALAQTAGSEVLDALIQRRDHPDPATYLGSGKARELAEVVAAAGADTVIVDGELAPSQRRALEDVVGVKVVDRTALILDIFAQHAKSREGKAQVELAQLEYLLPRLRGWGESMSRPAGTKRGSRRRGAIPSVAIAGYTNAGKSSLMNRLTEAGIMVEDALFATLDPTVRRAETSEGRTYTLTDTVGFVRNLPHELIEAFRSTLEEVAGADLVLHVVDAAHPDPLSQVAAVRTVLSEIPGALDVPELIVLNKTDLADAVTLAALRTGLPRAVAVSARTGEGIEELRACIEQMLPHPQVSIDVVVPYSRGDLVSRVHAEGEIDTVDYVETGTHVVARVGAALAAEIEGATAGVTVG